MRDRRGRGIRGAIAPSAVPIARSRAQIFDDSVVAAVERIQGGFPELVEVEIVIEEVPPRAVRDGSPDPVPLGRVTHVAEGSPAQLVIYRRPIELRASGRSREALISDTVTELVAELFGLAPIQVDPDYAQVL